MASHRGHAEGWEGLQFSRQRTQKKGIKVSHYRKQCVPLGAWSRGDNLQGKARNETKVKSRGWMGGKTIKEYRVWLLHLRASNPVHTG